MRMKFVLYNEETNQIEVALDTKPIDRPNLLEMISDLTAKLDEAQTALASFDAANPDPGTETPVTSETPTDVAGTPATADGNGIAPEAPVTPVAPPADNAVQVPVDAPLTDPNAVVAAATAANEATAPDATPAPM